MAKPNYQFEKRQRELKKAQQQEQKRLKKLAAEAGGAPAAETEAETPALPPQENP